MSHINTAPTPALMRKKLTALPLMVTIAIHCGVLGIVLFASIDPPKAAPDHHYKAVMLAPQTMTNQHLEQHSETPVTVKKNTETSESTPKTIPDVASKTMSSEDNAQNKTQSQTHNKPQTKLAARPTAKQNIKPIVPTPEIAPIKTAKPMVQAKTLPTPKPDTNKPVDIKAKPVALPAKKEAPTAPTIKSTPTIKPTQPALNLTKAQTQQKVKPQSTKQPPQTTTKTSSAVTPIKPKTPQQSASDIANEQAQKLTALRTKKAQLALSKLPLVDDESEINDLKAKIAHDDKARAEAEANRKAQALLQQQQEQAKASALAVQNNLLEQYRNKIQRNIKAQWRIPADIKDNRTSLSVTILPGGEVGSIVITKSSGNAAFDASIKSAIEDASPLPVPEDNALFQKLRVLKLTFNGLEL